MIAVDRSGDAEPGHCCRPSRPKPQPPAHQASPGYRSSQVGSLADEKEMKRRGMCVAALSPGRETALHPGEERGCWPWPCPPQPPAPPRAQLSPRCPQGMKPRHSPGGKKSFQSRFLPISSHPISCCFPPSICGSGGPGCYPSCTCTPMPYALSMSLSK